MTRLICPVCRRTPVLPSKPTLSYRDPKPCLACRREAAVLRTANYRAMEIGAPATLTVADWHKILARYRHRCAYCGGPYDVMDHAAGIQAGTTPANCRPACFRCNVAKGSDPTFRPKPTVPTRTARGAYAAVWTRWEAAKLPWTAAGLGRFANRLLATGARGASVYGTLTTVLREGAARGLPDLRAATAALRANLRSPP